MCLTKYPLDEETRKFFNNWGDLEIITFYGETIKAKELFAFIMPRKNGSLELFYHDGRHITIRIFNKTITVKPNIDDHHWLQIFWIREKATA